MHVNGPSGAQTLISYESLSVPEPATLMLTGIALVALATRIRRRKTRAAA